MCGIGLCMLLTGKAGAVLVKSEEVSFSSRKSGLTNHGGQFTSEGWSVGGGQHDRLIRTLPGAIGKNEWAAVELYVTNFNPSRIPGNRINNFYGIFNTAGGAAESGTKGSYVSMRKLLSGPDLFTGNVHAIPVTLASSIQQQLLSEGHESTAWRHIVNSSTELKRWLDETVNRLAPGAALPGDKVLAQQFGISHMTVRRVMTDYARRNKVVRIQGTGTVTPGKPPDTPPLPGAAGTSAHAIYGHIKQSIGRGEIRLGEPLPAVKLLCRQFHVTSKTVRRAYMLLVDDGLACKAGKCYWVGSFHRLSRLPARREIVLLSDERFDLQRLYTTDYMALSFRKMESELLSHGYTLTYRHYHDLSMLLRNWKTGRTVPHGIILTGAHRGRIGDREFNTYYPMVSRAFARRHRLAPRMLVITMASISRAKGVWFFSTSHTATILARTLAHFLFHQQARSAAVLIDERTSTAGEIFDRLRIYPEIDHLDDSMRLAYVVKSRHPADSTDAFFQRLFRNHPVERFRRRMGKYRTVDMAAIRALFQTPCSFTQWMDTLQLPATVICEKDSIAVEILDWCTAHRIPIPSRLSIITLENGPAYLHRGISACVRDWESIGYSMAHALIGDIPIEKTHRGFIECRARLLHRRTTDFSRGP